MASGMDRREPHVSPGPDVLWSRRPRSHVVHRGCLPVGSPLGSGSSVRSADAVFPALWTSPQPPARSRARALF